MSDAISTRPGRRVRSRLVLAFFDAQQDQPQTTTAMATVCGSRKARRPIAPRGRRPRFGEVVRAAGAFIRCRHHVEVEQMNQRVNGAEPPRRLRSFLSRGSPARRCLATVVLLAICGECRSSVPAPPREPTPGPSLRTQIEPVLSRFCAAARAETRRSDPGGARSVRRTTSAKNRCLSGRPPRAGPRPETGRGEPRRRWPSARPRSPAASRSWFAPAGRLR